MLTVYRRENSIDKDVSYEVLINGCFMGKINNGEKITIDMKDRDKLNFTLSDELVLKMQIVSPTHKSAEIQFDYEDHQTVEFECEANYTEGLFGKIIDSLSNKSGIKLEKTKDFILY